MEARIVGGAAPRVLPFHAFDMSERAPTRQIKHPSEWAPTRQNGECVPPASTPVVKRASVGGPRRFALTESSVNTSRGTQFQFT